MALNKAEAERLMKQRELENQIYAVARQRRINSAMQTALDDPGRYAPQVYNQAKQWEDDRKLRAHEINMIEKKGNLDVKKEEAHSQGLRGYGAEAAEINSKTSMYEADKKAETERERITSSLIQAEKEMASREKIAGMEHANREKIADVTGRYGVLQEQERAKGMIARTDLEIAKHDRAIEGKVQAALIDANGKVDASKTRSYAKIIGDAIRSGAASAVPKDANTVFKELSEANKNNPELLSVIASVRGSLGKQPANDGVYLPVETKPKVGQKEGDRKNFKDGVGVFRGGKWVLEGK